MREPVSKSVGHSGAHKVYLLDEVPHALVRRRERVVDRRSKNRRAHVVFARSLRPSRTRSSRPSAAARSISSSRWSRPTRWPRHVRWIAGEAGLNVNDDMIDYVIRVGGGSCATPCRHSISHRGRWYRARRLDRQRAVERTRRPRCGGALIATVAEPPASASIRQSIVRIVDRSTPIGSSWWRWGPRPAQLTDSEFARAQQFSTQLSPGALTHALEIIAHGSGRHAPCPRPRSISKSRWSSSLASPSDTSLDALVARIERLERRLERGAAPNDAPHLRRSPQPPPAPPSAPPARGTVGAHALAEPPAEPPAAPAGRSSPRDEARQQLGPIGAPAPTCAIGSFKCNVAAGAQRADSHRSPRDHRRRRCTRAARVDRIVSTPADVISPRS